MPSTQSASRRPYRSHKTPACDRCRRFKRRCTGGGPGDPCVLCKLQNVPCQPSSIAKSHTPSSRSPKVDYALPRLNQRSDTTNSVHASPHRPNVRSGLGDSESHDHNAIHLDDARAESSIVVSPVLTEDIQALERYFSSGALTGDPAPAADGLEKSLVYMRVPRRREGLAMAKNPGKIQKEIIWQIFRPFARELVKLYFEKFHPAFPILDQKTFLEIYERSDKISPPLFCEFFALSLTLWDHSDLLRQYPKPDPHFICNIAVESLQQDFLAPGLSTIYSVLFDMTGRPIFSILGNTINNGRSVALARSLGLNRDPTNWKRPDSEKVLRIRLWWAVLIHDYWSSFAHGISPNITNRQYDVPVPALRDLTHDGQSEDGQKASECFIHLCTLSVILGDILPLVYDLEQRDIWRDIRRREAELDTWEQNVSLPINGPNEKYPYPVSGLSSLCLSLLSIRLLLCRVAFRAANKTSSQDMDRATNLRYHLGRLRRSAQDIVEYFCSLEKVHLQEFWLVYTAHHLTFTFIILLRCTIEASDAAVAESCKASLVQFWAKLQDAAENDGWDLAAMCISRCGEAMSKVMSYSNSHGNKQAASNDGVAQGADSVPEGVNRHRASNAEISGLGDSIPNALPFSNLDLLFENSADTFWSGLDFTPLYDEVDAGQAYLVALVNAVPTPFQAHQPFRRRTSTRRNLTAPAIRAKVSTPNMSMNNIVVVGAGVTGLTTALLLSKNSANKITVIAKHMPGDYDIEYASPWAGASYMPFGKKDSDHAEWERATWPALRDLAANYPESGIHFQDITIQNRLKDQTSVTGQWSAELTSANPWFKDFVLNFENLPRDQLPPGIDNAQKFTSVCINTAIYLPWLVSQCMKNGCVFKRASLMHISDASETHHTGNKADVVVNCTGLASRTLGGVADDQVYPIRGQIMIVRNDPGSMTSISGSDDGGEEVTYIFPRATGGGTVIGGTYQKNNWDPLPDPNFANRIMQRALKLDPRLVKEGQGVEGLDIVRHGVGLRPGRTDGPRIEKDKVNGVNVVHNYGHGGFGYQVSFSCAEKAAGLVNEIIQQKDRAKL
ncbi:hypothetical protein F1880_004779 [Penicillium rolfsii]|nr:hypothetical protein F1880_004779 [Penicillium rolfsii]